MTSLRNAKGGPSRVTLTEDINGAGFSDPLPPELARVTGYSELLARPRSRKGKARRLRHRQCDGAGRERDATRRSANAYSTRR